MWKQSTLKLLVISLVFFSCSQKQNGTNNQSPVDTIVRYDTQLINNSYDWQEGFGLTHDPEIDSIWGRPVKFYIDNPKCSPTAIDFYNGQFRPGDNHTTAALLSLATTGNTELRPFYRWCLNKTIQIQDGALAEYTGVPARKYAEKFPTEFFEYMDSDSSGNKYEDWVNSIMYSGFYDYDDYKNPAEIRKRMTDKMNKNCNDCNKNMLSRIEKFAKDCFE